MSLVPDYGTDSEDDSINEEQTDKSNTSLQKNNESNDTFSIELQKPEKADLVSENTLFSKLPHTKPKSHNFEPGDDQIEDFIPKSNIVKGKQKVKISIPSLSSFNDDDDDEPKEKKIKLSSKGTGLLSLLPPVRGAIKTAKSFVPNVVSNKNKAHAKLQPKKMPVKKPLPKKEKKPVVSDAESGDEDIELPETFDDEMWQKVCGRPKPKPVIKDPEPEITDSSVNIAPEPEKQYDGLDNVAFKELVGKTKRPIGNIKLIDINEEEILPDKDLWMTKSLTDPELAPKSKVENPVDPTRRKKHHITYLAEQAKANEQELASTWAASKNSRMASRAKYGF